MTENLQRCVQSMREVVADIEREGCLAVALVALNANGSFSYTSNAEPFAGKLAIISALRLQADLLQAEVQGAMMQRFAEQVRAMAEKAQRESQGSKVN